VPKANSSTTSSAWFVCRPGGRSSVCSGLRDGRSPPLRGRITNFIRYVTGPWRRALLHRNTARAANPHFDSNGSGGDIVVFAGTAAILPGYPAAPDNSGWLEKYSEEIDARFGDAVKFAETYSVPVRIHLTRVRGF
jgi:hypothetical protein